MTRKEKIKWLVENMDLYPLAKSEPSFYAKMFDDDLDALIRIEKSRGGKRLGKKEVLEMVKIVRNYQKGTEAYHRPWRQWMDNYELLN